MSFYYPSTVSKARELSIVEDEEDVGDNLSAAIIEDYMQKHEAEYCKFSDLSIFVGTFNVNGKDPPNDLYAYLSDRIDKPPHIYAIGFQELDLSVSVLMWGTPSPQEPKWKEAVERSLHPSAEYEFAVHVKRWEKDKEQKHLMQSASSPPNSFTEKILFQLSLLLGWAFGEQNLLVTNVLIYMGFGALGDFLEQRHMMLRGQMNVYDWHRTRTFVLAACPIGAASHYWYKWLDKAYPENSFKVVIKKIAGVRTVGIYLMVYAQKLLKKHITAVEKHRVNTGAFGGGLVELGNKGGVSVRLKCKDTSICFVNCHLAAGDGEDSFKSRNEDFLKICNELRFPDAYPMETTIFDHDVLFLMGDLNYRLQTTKNGRDMDIVRVKELCAMGNILTLLEHDQLREMQQFQQTRHHEFSEGVITFMPTYKYDTGTDNWDSSEKNRVPSWCDRILWIDRTNYTTISQYGSIPVIQTSDHKPVRALFKSRVRLINLPLRDKVKQLAITHANRVENQALPKIHVDDKQIDFGCVKFMSSKVQYITLTNGGLYPVKCKFKRSPDHPDRVCKPWLMLSPTILKIEPGKEEYVSVQLLIDKYTAHELNAGGGRKDICDTLVLHSVGGGDHFVCITAVYEPTIFACSLENLIQREAHEEQPLICLDDSDNKPAELKNVPKELWRIVECIKKQNLRSTNLFGGSHKDFDLIRDILDNKQPFPESEEIRTSAMEALVIFLDSLPRRVIPQEYVGRCYELCLGLTVVACTQVSTNQWQNSQRTNFKKPSALCLGMFIDSLPPAHAATFRYLIRFARDILKANDCARNPLIEEELDLITLDDICYQYAYLLFPCVQENCSNPRAVQTKRDSIRRFLKYCIEFESLDVPKLS